MRFSTDGLRRTCGALAIAVAATVSACAPMATDPTLIPASTPDRTVLLRVEFGFDSHRIRPESYAELDNLAAAMLGPGLSGYRFQIDGHTDRSGRLAYNLALSRLRASAVVDYLAARGVPRDLMFEQGFGYLLPIDAYNPYSPVNRRVEVTTIR